MGKSQGVSGSESVLEQRFVGYIQLQASMDWEIGIPVRNSVNVFLNELTTLHLFSRSLAEVGNK